MGYYSIIYLLKNIIFNFRKIFKYILLSICMIFFIILCLLLFQCSSSASSYITYEQTIDNTNYTFSIDSDVMQAVQSSMLNDTDYYWIAYYQYESSGNYHWNIFAVEKANVSSGFKFLLKRNASNKVDFWNSNQTCTVYFADYIFGQPLSFSTSSTSNLTRYNYYCVEDPNATYYFFGNMGGSQLQTGSNTYTNIDFTYSTFIEPEFLNAEDSHWSNTLVNGEFNYFFIDCNDAEYVSFTIQDMTLIEQNYNIDYNSFSQTFNLWETNYIYNVALRQYAIPKTDLRNGFYNNHEYKYTLSWTVDNVSDSKTWTVTTDFSQATITNDEEIQKNNMEQDLSSINNFLSDDSYNSSSITQSMPSETNTDPTASQVNNIFNMIRTAFSTTNANDVVFEVPNTDQTITIPANLVSQHIPQPILILIQSFYWFIICRFIIKDISKTVEHAKSGEILDAKDGNIKTDLL